MQAGFHLVSVDSVIYKFNVSISQTKVFLAIAGHLRIEGVYFVRFFLAACHEPVFTEVKVGCVSTQIWRWDLENCIFVTGFSFSGWLWQFSLHSLIYFFA